MYKLSLLTFLFSIFNFVSASGNDSIYTDFQGDLFVAIPIPEDVQDDIELLQELLKPLLGKTFVPLDLSNLHITIQVIGKTTNMETLDKINTVLRTIQHPPFSLGSEITSGKLRIKTKNVKLKLSSDSLTALSHKVRNLLSKSGVTILTRFDHPHNTHITIGTINTKKIKHLKIVEKRANQMFSSLKEIFHSFHEDNFIVNSFSLLKSNHSALTEERIYAPLRIYHFPIKY